MDKIRGFRGDIPLVAWGILLSQWIENMRDNLVESVFEEDIFYWWTDEFDAMRDRDVVALFSPDVVDNEILPFGKCLSDVMFTLYKYDFSKIVGDPLGDLYQKYFDRDTRKVLGEFYTPKEVVSYILDSVGYNGQFIKEKRLLDPACGSGTFLVDALKRYLDTSTSNAKKNGWGKVLTKLCNEYHIVGFDIHPFATIMSQIHFMLVLLPYYKEAIETEKGFVLRRIPIFRTDSLAFERKEEREDITSLADGGKNVRLSIPLPVKKKIDDSEFLKIRIVMPRSQEVWDKTDLTSYQQYFCALQAIFDTVKYQSRSDDYGIDTDLLERRFKEYLQDKKWSELVGFFAPYGDQILSTIKDLRYKFGDGRLVKSIEDVMLGGLLKNYVKYDYVVGNPPYVRFHGLSEEDKKSYSKNFKSAYKQYDLYVLFVEKGVRWLNEDGRFGYIISSKFCASDYGKNLRRYLLDNVSINEIVDVSSLSIFKDASIYPYILTMEKEGDEKKRMANGIRISVNIKNEETFTDRQFDTELVSQSRFHNNADFLFDLQAEEGRLVVDKIEKGTSPLKDIAKVTRGFRPPPEQLIISQARHSQLTDAKQELYKKLIIGKDIVSSFRLRWSGNYLDYRE
ncbi:MAG: N-6 DNA methylase, partial [Thermoplasmata archaeon]|nr:N-6 DNA methylase [Thermoplasmata archaeon]